MSIDLTFDGRVKLYTDWRGVLFGFQWDDAIIAVMFGPFTLEVWWRGE